MTDIDFSRGYIPLPRDLFNLAVSKDHRLWFVFCYFLRRARYKAGKRSTTKGVVDLDVGQLLTGRDEAARDCYLSVRSYRTALKKLVKLGFVTTNSSSLGTIVTVLNFERFGDSELWDRPAKRPEDDQKATKKRPKGDQKTPTKEESKNGKNGKNGTDPRNWDNSIPGMNSLPAKKKGLLVNHCANAIHLWNRQEELRRESIPGTRSLIPHADRLVRIAERLEGGSTVEDCEHVLRVFASEAKSDRDNAKWFNGETNWRPKNFDRALGQPSRASRANPLAGVDFSEPPKEDS